VLGRVVAESDVIERQTQRRGGALDALSDIAALSVVI